MMFCRPGNDSGKLSINSKGIIGNCTSGANLWYETTRRDDERSGKRENSHLLFVVCCLLFVVCCLLFVVCCLLFVVCCLLFVVAGADRLFTPPCLMMMLLLFGFSLFLTVGLLLHDRSPSRNSSFGTMLMIHQHHHHQHLLLPDHHRDDPR
jgi:hypothetical protein